MLTVASQLASYIYPEEEDPEGAFNWWLSPYGGTDLVPDDIKKVFDVLNSIPSGVSSFKTPKKIKKGSGKKGDDGNPKAPTKPRPGGGTSKPRPKNGGVKKKCNVPSRSSTMRLGAQKKTIRYQSCDKNNVKKTSELIVTSLTYAANARPTQNVKDCKAAWGQACYHCSSAIRVNPQWATITCPQEAATTAHRQHAKATATWSSQHRGKGWQKAMYRQEAKYDRDEYPPANLMGPHDQAFVQAGWMRKANWYVGSRG
ncbi:hypothetical protein SLS60_001811 [Paraconiothyrium brasiliense]|uniref:Uncharacterized protein n=1 Tax=Paraconiothyrium brasiliense TaxID=300254 RepID=A0ABR3S0F3_9PLEO